MNSVGRILVVIDPTAQSQPAAERAVWVAEKAKAQLEFFICDYDQYLAGERFFDSRSLERARKSLLDNHCKRMRKLVDKLAPKLDVAVDASWDKPLHDGIVRKVVASKPDLVFKDTHYHSALKRSIFSNTDWNLIRDCPAPLWLVKPGPWSEGAPLIAAVDPVHERDKPAALDHAILELAFALGDQIASPVHAVHGYDPSPALAVSADSMSFPIAMPIVEMTEALKEQHGAAVAELVAKYELAEDQVHVVEGDTQDVLSGAVEKLHAGAVLMGAVARGALQRLMLGSTAERVLDRLACDLIIVKSPGDESVSVSAEAN